MLKIRWIQSVLLGVMAVLVVVACTPAKTPTTQSSANAPETAPLTQLTFGVEPYFPTPNENRKQFEPLF